MQLALRRSSSADCPNRAGSVRRAAGRNSRAGENPPCLRDPARYSSLALVEERVDGGLNRRGEGCGHIRRRQLPAIASVRFATRRRRGSDGIARDVPPSSPTLGSISPSRCCEKSVKTSGHSVPRDGAIGGRPNAGASSSRMATLARCSRLLTASTLTPRIVATSGADNPSTSRSSRTSRWEGSSASMACVRAFASSRLVAVCSGFGLGSARCGGVGGGGVQRLFARRGELASAPLLDAEPARDGVEPTGD